MYLYTYIAYFVVLLGALVTPQVSEENNEWLIISKNAQNSIKDSVAKVKAYEISDSKVKSVTNKAFSEFVLFVKNGLSPIFEKLNKTSGKNPRIKTKLINWIDNLERLNNSTNSSKSTPQDSFDKFENTIKKMVENAPQFAQKINSASPEYHEVLLDIGSFMKEVIKKLATNMKGVESELKTNRKTVQENEWLALAKNAQSNIEDSIIKIKTYEINEDKIKFVTDNAFDEFVKYVKNGVTPIYEKLDQIEGGNPKIKTKLNNWIEELERLNNGYNISPSAQEPMTKFKNSIQNITENTPNFVEKLNSASPQHREILLKIGIFMKDVINKLMNNMKSVESELLNIKKNSEKNQGKQNKQIQVVT